MPPLPRHDKLIEIARRDPAVRGNGLLDSDRILALETKLAVAMEAIEGLKSVVELHGRLIERLKIERQPIGGKRR